MNTRSHEPYWLIKNSLEHSYPSLKEDLAAENLIIGGGITGALMAYRLVKAGKKAILIDKRDIASGSTAASTALLQYEIDVPLYELIEKRGLTCAVESYKKGEQAIKNLGDLVNEIQSDCGFEYKKSVYFSRNRKDLEWLKKEYDCRKEHGFDVEWLDKEELLQMGLDARAAILSKTAAVVDAYKLANDLLHACNKKGLKIFDRTEIQDIKPNKELLEVRCKNKFKLSVRNVIHCTGYESTETLKENVVDLKSTFAMASEVYRDFPQAFKDHIFWSTDAPYLYFRGTPDKRIIMGGGDVPFKNAKSRDAMLPKKVKQLQKDFKKCFPQLDFSTDYSWAGTFGETEDGLPYMGKPELDKNEHYILGFGGNGISFSLMGMDALLPSLEDEPHPYLEYYKFNR
jgi:glycine/D-amino acid oxidase-like deaminating enzyme